MYAAPSACFHVVARLVNHWKGRQAVPHTGVVLLLVPADPLRPRRADEHFAAEAAAARDAGITVALIDHDALADPDGAGRAVARVPGPGAVAVYRGWMRAPPSTACWRTPWPREA